MAAEATGGEMMEQAEVGSSHPASIDFLNLTPSKFGISVQSFTPMSSTLKEKSRLAQIKARRRSSIGVRGSPETNSLIRFIAQQKMKNVPQQQTPEGSPFLPRVASSLKQKMASFQALMDVEEKDFGDRIPKRDGGGGCVETEADVGKENHPPMTSPAPSKRRRVGSVEVCEIEITEAHSPAELEEEDEPAPPTVPTVEEATALLVSPPSLDVQDDVFEDQSSSRQEKTLIASQPRPSSLSCDQFVPSQLEMKPTGEEAKKKRVHFGVPLPPEFFDRNLPPSTPLQKGGTPARAQTPGGDLKLRSLLKTPQRNELDAPPAKRFGSPVDVGASPKLSMPRNRRMKSLGEDREMEEAKVFFPLMDDLDSALISETECMADPQQDLNAAFQEETASPAQTVSATKLSPITQTDDLDEIKSLPEKPQECPEAQTRSRTCSRKGKVSTELESTSEAPARCRSRKRKLSDGEPVKRSTRSAAKSAAGKMKASAAARQWKKEVNRSLYSNREYASKLPALSPISESLAFIVQSPPAELSPTGPDESPGVTQRLTDDSPGPKHADDTDEMKTVEDDAPEDSAAPLSSEGASEEESLADVGGSQRSDCGPDQLSEETEDGTVGALEGNRQVQTAAAKTDSVESACPDVPPVSDEPAKPKKGRRSSVRQAEKAPSPKSNNSFECKDEKQEPDVTFAPWHVEFNIEDVLKPAPTRGRRSVRRSLRNQQITDDGAGLAWLPRTSPDATRKSRRRSTNHRLPAQSSP